MNEINGYTNILAWGHKFLSWMAEDVIIIEEKIDGSQFSMMKKDGELVCRSRNTQINLDDPGMFAKAVETAKTLDLHDGWIYRCEYLSKPKHNTLAYERVPAGNLIVFDIDTGNQCYLDVKAKTRECENIGLERITHLGYEKVDNITTEMLDSLLKYPSALGGMMEGIVLKNYNRIGADGKISMAKYVSSKFKEIHTTDLKERNPSRSDFMETLVMDYRTEARWMKAVSHLKENDNTLVGAMNDVPVLMKEVSTDILSECAEEIKDKLFGFFWKTYSKRLTQGLPEWYKNYLAGEQ